MRGIKRKREKTKEMISSCKPGSRRLSTALRPCYHCDVKVALGDTHVTLGDTHSPSLDSVLQEMSEKDEG